MNLSKYSKNRIMETFAYWRVNRDFAEPMYNYLVYGYRPGSCFTSVLANDFHGAIMHSHPSNTVESFKNLTRWVNDTVPKQARGSYQAIEDWLNADKDVRRIILEVDELVYSAEKETWLILQDEPIKEVVLY